MEIIPSLPNDIARECLIRVPYNHFSTLYSVCKTWKEEIESRNFHIQRKVLGFSRSIVVLAQPDSTLANQLTLYEPVTGDWRRLPLDPYEFDGLPLFCHFAGVGRNLVVIGGWNSRTWECSNTTRVFDFVSGTWHRGANMPGPPRSFFACASDSDRTVYVAGGHTDEGKTALRSVLAYDVVNDEWVPLPDMARERDECKGLFHAGKFHVIGGYGTEMQGLFEKSAEVFDTATCQWDQVEDLLETGACPRNCVMDEEGRMYCHLEGHVAVLDGSTWRKVRELPVDVSVCPFFVTCWGRILVIGSSGYDNPIRSYELEIGEDYTWSKVVMPKVFDRSVQTGCSLEI